MKKKPAAKVKRSSANLKKVKVKSTKGGRVVKISIPVQAKASPLADPRYAQAVENYQVALKAMQEHKFEKAKALFQKVMASGPRELADRTAVHLNTWLMKGFFDTIPAELDESARVDGATPAQVFWGVVLPLAAPVLAVIALISFIATLNEFVIASVILETQQKFTLPVGLWQFIDQKYSEHWGPFAAGVLIAAIPAALLFVFLQRYIVEGLTQGAVKG